MANKDRDAVNQGLSDIFGSASSDILSGVIASDRRRAGRKAEVTAESPILAENPSEAIPTDASTVMTSHSASKQYDIMASNVVMMQPDNVADGQYDKPASVDGEPRRPKQKRALSGQAGLIGRRVRQAQDMAKSSTTTVTLRIPRELNDWLDEYVHRAWPEKVRKQELVIEALQILFARRGRAGEEVVETELLRESDRGE